MLVFGSGTVVDAESNLSRTKTRRLETVVRVLRPPCQSETSSSTIALDRSLSNSIASIGSSLRCNKF